ncbi:MAG: CPBP family intramembrane glutamic endopeptidase, partial [Pirellulaceae bacterium]
ERNRLVQISVLELIDVIIVLAAFFSISRAVVTTRPNHGLGFLLLFPMLALALGINFGYHWIINNHLGVMEGPSETQSMSYLPWYIVVICLQPAIIEELFFRSVLFRPLQKVMGNHMTVMVTSVMFGVAHIYVPLSIPMLISMGIILGYLRLWTGSLIVPMLLHFIHNGVILALQLQA